MSFRNWFIVIAVFGLVIGFVVLSGASIILSIIGALTGDMTPAGLVTVVAVAAGMALVWVLRYRWRSPVCSCGVAARALARIGGWLRPPSSSRAPLLRSWR